MESCNKINVLIYALPNTTSGGLSVVQNLYEDIKVHADLYPDIHWHFIVGVDVFHNTNNISVYNDEWALKSYFSRWLYNITNVRKFVREHEIDAVISLNMSVNGLKVPSIISMHNVLPLYRCDSSVFDSRVDIVKQAIRNRLIVKSLKHAEYVIVPGKWIVKRLMEQFGISEDRIVLSPIITPEINSSVKRNEKTEDGIYRFIYPSTGFPYKNHRVVVEAVRILNSQGITGYRVLFAGNVGDGKTISAIKDDIALNKLPIEFCGVLSKDELASLYSTGTLVFPSKIETDGFPLLESMACDGDILASNLDYAREALEGYDNYSLFDPDDAGRLADLMKDILLHPKTNKQANSSTAVPGVPRTSVIVPLIRKIKQND